MNIKKPLHLCQKSRGMYKEIFISVISEQIEQNKMNKRELAKLLNISYPTYLKLLKSGEFTLSQLDVLCKRFNLAMAILPKRYLECV